MFLCLTSCYSTQKAVSIAQPYGAKINWPADYLPEDADFYIHNKIQINASPEVVWDLLVNAEDWPNWYEGMSNVAILNSDNPQLQATSEVRFTTMNRDFNGFIREFEPYERLAWETKNEKLAAYHAWLIIPNAQGCLLVTDEVQKGKLANMQKLFLPNKLKNLHDVWLVGFKEKAEQSTN